MWGLAVHEDIQVRNGRKSSGLVICKANGNHKVLDGTDFWGWEGKPSTVLCGTSKFARCGILAASCLFTARLLVAVLS